MLQSVLRLVVNVLDWTFLIVMQGRASTVTRDFHLPSTRIAGFRDKTHHATSSKW
jgi:hypothetical protein